MERVPNAAIQDLPSLSSSETYSFPPSLILSPSHSIFKLHCYVLRPSIAFFRELRGLKCGQGAERGGWHLPLSSNFPSSCQSLWAWSSWSFCNRNLIVWLCMGALEQKLHKNPQLTELSFYLEASGRSGKTLVGLGASLSSGTCRGISSCSSNKEEYTLLS